MLSFTAETTSKIEKKQISASKYFSLKLRQEVVQIPLKNSKGNILNRKPNTVKGRANQKHQYEFVVLRQGQKYPAIFDEIRYLSPM